jgi:hypothetical protein
MGGGYQEISKDEGRLFRSCSGRSADTGSMADFLVALSIIGFALVFLGLIWALDRV